MKTIVITSIYSPQIATLKYANIPGWNVVVVGDMKTPDEEYDSLKNITYLSPDNQKKLYPELSELIGWNSIDRRNIGYAYAYKMGASVIASVDDDNIPLENWGKNLYIDKPIECKLYTTNNCPVFDPLSVTTYNHLWHRGFPIYWLKEKNNISYENKKIIPSFQANFWNGDPDIDAIARLEHYPNCDFSKDNIFPFSSSILSPFNSQNTFISRNAIKDYFCFPFIGRMDDIWGAYYALSKGHKVIYDEATVYQDRNIHDNIIDFENEIIGYKNSHKLVLDIDNIQNYIPERSWRSFLEYQKLFN